jgi:hypothetical protein
LADRESSLSPTSAHLTGFKWALGAFDSRDQPDFYVDVGMAFFVDARAKPREVIDSRQEGVLR